MKFYEFDAPYYALVKAADQEEVLELYKRLFPDNKEVIFYRTVKRSYAFKKYIESTIKREGFDEDSLCESVEVFKNDKNELLLLDGGLI